MAGSGYSRQSVATIVPTAVIRAAPINAELDKLRDAFTQSDTGTTGHRHDGSSDEGSHIPFIADLDKKNHLSVDQTNNRFGVFVEVGGSAVEQVRFQDGAVVPVTDSDIDLGTSSLEFKDLYLDGTATVDTLQVDENGTVTGNFTINGNTTLGNTTSDTVSYTARSASDFLPSSDGTHDLGSSTNEWQDLHIDGTANIDTLQVDESASVTANISVGGNTSTTGNNAIGGTLSVTGATGIDGNFDINTNKFTVAASSGNTAIAGTLGVTGAITGDVTGDLTGNVTASSGTTTLNNLTVNGTVDFTNTTLVNVSDPTADQHAATKAYVDTEVSNLVDSAPGALNTLNELAAAINDDASFSTTITNSIATKLPLAGGTMSGAIAMGNNKITGLGTPTASTDAATKGYIDSTFSATSAAQTSANAAAASATSAANSFDQFDDRYLGSKSSNPSVDNDGDALLTGALYYNSTAEELKVYTGSIWKNAGSTVNGTSSRTTATASSNQTSFSVTYDVGFVDVYLNGIKLLVGTDFTATNGTSVVLSSGATAGDIVDIVAYGAFELANHYTQTQSDARYLLESNNLSDLTSASTALTNLGVTSTAAELNILDGVTSTATELNLLDGVTASTAELNYVDGVTSAIQTQIDAKQPYATIAVTVSNPGSGNKYYLDGGLQQLGLLTPSVTYRFDQSDSSNSGHPLRLSTTSDGTHGGGSAFTTGVTAVGTPGNAGAYTQVKLEQDAPDTLYYYCTNHSGMGGEIDVKATVSSLSDLSITATAAELNIMDGVTSTTAELNILDGVTSTATELNILDGVTATTTELNYVDVTTLGLTQASKAVTADANGVVSFDNGTIEESTSVTSSSNAATINLRDGNVFTHTLSENVTYTFSNPAASGRASAFILKVTQDSSARTITWPSSVDWAGATAPTITASSGGVDVFGFLTVDGGTNYYGFTLAQALG